jgi:BTB/POZ domain-containing protein KCTD9
MNKRKCFKVLSRTAWLIFHFSGLRFIWQKISPPGGHSIYEKPPSTFVLWLVSAYVAFFGIASIRYENRIDKIENRAHSIFTQLSTPTYKRALSRIPRVQNMQCPYNPTILDPLSVFRSLFLKECEYSEMVGLLKETMENWKASLDSVDLREAKLQEANLELANLQEANLTLANLKKANLIRANLVVAQLWLANLQEANLPHANLMYANLMRANLQGAKLMFANLQRTVLSNADLQGAFLMHANLQEIEYSSIEQLSKVESLYRAKLDPKLEQQLRRNYPHLFQTPAERDRGG